VGEAVVTTLTKQATPLVRYRTRDLTFRYAAPCECGSPYPCIGPTVAPDSPTPSESNCITRSAYASMSIWFRSARCLALSVRRSGCLTVENSEVTRHSP
jgi:hypothetical protein